MGADQGPGVLPEGEPSLDSVMFGPLFEASPVAMMITDLADGRYLHVNEAFERLSGWPRDEVIGRTTLEVARWVDPERRAQMMVAVREHGFVANHHGSFLDRDGRERSGVFSAQVIELAGRRCLFVVANDVDEQIARDLRGLEERYRTVAELTTDFAFNIGVKPDGTIDIEWITDAFTRILGYEPEEIDQGGWLAFVHPDDVDRAATDFQRNLAGESISSELRMRAKDGAYHWLSFRSHPRWDADHRSVTGFIGAARDVTQEHEQRIALESTEERYRNLVERVPAVTYIWDARWRPGEAPAQYVSPQIEQLLGYRLEEWQADPRIWHERVHPDDLGWVLERWAQAEAAHEPFLVEYRMFTKAGHERWIRDEAHQIAGGAEGATQWQGVMIDITDRKHAEEALAESEARLRVLVSHVPGVMWTTDTDLVITSSEGGALPSLGLEAGQLVGADLAAFLQSDDPEYLPVRMHHEALAGAANGWDLEYGGLYWTSHVEPLRDESGAIIGTIGLSLDVTEKRHAEDELRRYSERLQTLYDIGTAILAARSSSEIAREALGHIRALAGCERASVVEYRMDTEEAFWLAVDSSIETDVGEGRVARRNIWGDMPSFERGETRVVNDLTTDTAWSPSTEALVAEGIRSHLTVPLVAEGALIGTLNLGSTEPGHFSDQHLATAQQVAGQLAVALHQARLHEQVEAAATELERRLDDLRRADEQRRQLLARVVRAQEEERQRIASDIHDDSIQKMAAVGLRLESLRRRFGEDAEAREQVNQIEETVKVSIERLRHLMFELWPPALDRHGLADAVRTELDQTKATSGLDYRLIDELETEPSPETRTIAYRIIQEAVSNIRKHAGASNVEVRLTDREGGIDVRVADDGRGIDPVTSSPPGHLGLSAMRERAEMAGGWVRINGRSGKGTTVEFWLPHEAG